MQENEFEKQVKQLMEEFNMAPPDEAWKKIDQKLHVTRKRKFGFVFLLFFSLITAGLFIFYYAEPEFKNSNVTSAIKSNEPVQKDSVVTNSSNNLMLSKENVAGEKDASSNSVLRNTQHTVASGKNSSSINAAHGSSNKTTSLLLLKSIDNSSNNNNAGQQVEKTQLSESNNEALNNKPAEKDSANVPIIFTAANQPSVNTNTVSNDKKIIEADSIATVQNATVNTAKKTTIQYKGLSKWQWGINAFYGRNNAVEGLTNFEKSNSQYSSSPSTITNGDTIFNKHAYNTSGAYSFGIEVQRKIAKNSVLAAGLNYIHLSTKSDIGKRVDSTYAISSSNSFLVDNYFRRGTAIEYVNSYNFIELPVYFQHYFFRRKQFSFAFNAGISVRQLLNSNALTYSAYNNIYFSKDELLRKTQFQSVTGLNFEFITGKTTSIYAGPQFSYGLSGLMKNNDNGNYHFITYGIKAGLLFHKK